MSVNHKIEVGIADDHNLVRKALTNLINSFESYYVLIEAASGNELLRKISSDSCPQAIILDVIMADGNGYETARKLNSQYPKVKILALSMCTETDCVMRMFKYGARGFIAKNAEPEDLKDALDKIMKNELFLPADCASFVLDVLFDPEPKNGFCINDRELKLLKYLTTDMTYKEIADKMFISPKTVDDYKSNLCSKLKIRSRSGLVTYAIKNGLIQI
jgi:two-component system invasion response regulator UvrY